jgi:predicted dehydrogenase
LGGGSLLDIGIYPLFLAQLLFGNPIAIKAFAQIGKTGVDENCSMLLRFSENRHAILDSTIVNNTPTVAYIYGTKGRIKIHRRWHESNAFTLFEEGKDPQEYSFDLEGCRGYRFEIEEVMRCVQAGKKESDILPLSFSRDLMQLLDDVRKEIVLEYPATI